MVKKKEITISELAKILDRGFTGIQKQIDDLNLMTGQSFNDVQSQINDLHTGQKILSENQKALVSNQGGFAFEQKEFREEVNTKFSKLDKDMIWVKDVLEAHTKILKDLDEERIFIVHRTDRIEGDVELLKKRLKTA